MSAVVIDERSVAPCRSDIESPAADSKRFDYQARRVTLLRGGAKSAVSDCLVEYCECVIDARVGISPEMLSQADHETNILASALSICPRLASLNFTNIISA